MTATPAAAQPVRAEQSVAPWSDTLLRVAAEAIDHGLARQTSPTLDPDAFPPRLAEPRGVFVTLRDAAAQLRGCLGHVEGAEPLIVGVAECAFGAAFRDPRFPPLAPAERPGLAVKISVLTPLEPLAFDDEADIPARLEPGIDGVLIDAGDRRGTLLPAVWPQIPDPEAFWLAVKGKAGLEGEALPAGAAVYRYTAEEIG